MHSFLHHTYSRAQIGWISRPLLQLSNLLFESSRIVGQRHDQYFTIKAMYPYYILSFFLFPISIRTAFILLPNFAIRSTHCGLIFLCVTGDLHVTDIKTTQTQNNFVDHTKRPSLNHQAYIAVGVAKCRYKTPTICLKGFVALLKRKGILEVTFQNSRIMSKFINTSYLL